MDRIYNLNKLSLKFSIWTETSQLRLHNKILVKNWTKLCQKSAKKTACPWGTARAHRPQIPHPRVPNRPTRIPTNHPDSRSSTKSNERHPQIISTSFWKPFWSHLELSHKRQITTANGSIASTRVARTSSRTPMEEKGTMTPSIKISSPLNALTALRSSL